MKMFTDRHGASRSGWRGGGVGDDAVPWRMGGRSFVVLVPSLLTHPTASHMSNTELLLPGNSLWFRVRGHLQRAVKRREKEGDDERVFLE